MDIQMQMATGTMIAARLDVARTARESGANDEHHAKNARPGIRRVPVSQRWTWLCTSKLSVVSISDFETRGTMKSIRIAHSLVLGTALIAGCREPNGSTGRTATPTRALSAEVAAGRTSVVVDDSTEDWADIAGQNYQDEVRVEITKKGSTFVFVMTLAGAVQDNPPFPSWADMLLWAFALDTRPDSFPLGYPFTKNTATPWEFVIGHWVYAPGFTDVRDPGREPGTLMDRRPQLGGGEPKIIPIDFTIDGAKMTWVVDAASLGNPSTFRWGAGTSAWQSSGGDARNGYNNGRHFDQVPDLNLGEPLGTWPQEDRGPAIPARQSRGRPACCVTPSSSSLK